MLLRPFVVVQLHEDLIWCYNLVEPELFYPESLPQGQAAQN